MEYNQKTKLQSEKSNKEIGMDVTKKLRRFGIIVGVLLVALGVLCIARPAMVMEFMIWIIGCSLLVAGIGQCFRAFSRRKEEGLMWNLVPGIVLVVLSAIVLIYQGITLFTVGIFVGVMAFFMAFERFGVAKMRKRSGERYGPTVLFGIIQLLFGCCMISNCFVTMLDIIIFTGIYAICAGIMIIISGVMFHDL